MGSTQEITYKLVLKSPLLLPNWQDMPQREIIGKLTIPGSSLKGLTREWFQRLSRSFATEEVGQREQLLFGGIASAANVLFTDAYCLNQGESIEHPFLSTDGRTSTPSQEVLTRPTIPPGTEFVGKVIFTSEPSGIERCIALSAILDIPRSGKGYGDFDVQILDRSSTLVFISYSWEDVAHKEWVRNLALRLIREHIDVVLDQLAPSFNLNSPQDEINAWMAQSINNSDKVIAVLTPEYRQKAEIGIGGVGFEYHHLLTERGIVSKKLGRYVGVLRKGDYSESLPLYLKERPVIDMRPPFNEAERFADLIEAITS